MNGPATFGDTLLARRTNWLPSNRRSTGDIWVRTNQGTASAARTRSVRRCSSMAHPGHPHRGRYRRRADQRAEADGVAGGVDVAGAAAGSGTVTFVDTSPSLVATTGTHICAPRWPHSLVSTVTTISPWSTP